MNISEVEAKSILRKHKRIDSWFISHYGMNLYRGCIHNCAYCDGRAEGYYVEGEFGKDIVVKTNAIEVLNRELDPKRKRIPFKKSYMLVGGGVCDTYQAVEKKYQLTRKTLELIDKYHFPVHILTKSTLVLRDMQLIQRINENTQAIVSFSFSSVNETISSVFEPGVPAPGERLKALETFKNAGIPCGMFLLPVIPFVTDHADLIEESVKKAGDIGLDFIIFGGMTLKMGRQSEHFYKVLKKVDSSLIPKYQSIYSDTKWGQADKPYYKTIHNLFGKIAKKYNIPIRIPDRLFSNILEKHDLVIVMLEHIDYYLKINGRDSPFGYAAYSLSKLKDPLLSKKENLKNLAGVGTAIEKEIIEILETGTSTRYQQLAYGHQY